MVADAACGQEMVQLVVLGQVIDDSPRQREQQRASEDTGQGTGSVPAAEQSRSRHNCRVGGRRLCARAFTESPLREAVLRDRGWFVGVHRARRESLERCSRVSSAGRFVSVLHSAHASPLWQTRSLSYRRQSSNIPCVSSERPARALERHPCATDYVGVLGCHRSPLTVERRRGTLLARYVLAKESKY